jgi:thymidylate kinase
MKYKQTPSGIIEVLELFQRNKLSYILFKCEHIFSGQNKNLDILFENNDDYQRAAVILSKWGFKLRLSEKVEKYKTMYTGIINNIMYSIHLHREIAWHGMRALDKKHLFQRKEIGDPKGFIITPSLEDSILIHAGHVLFENFRITGKESQYLDEFRKNKSINRRYINMQLKNNHWKCGFNLITKSKEGKVCKRKIFSQWLVKLSLEPLTLFYLMKKAIKIPLRQMKHGHRGCLIALIGVNGTGKSTLAREVLENYSQITNHLGVKQCYYYFGWRPTFFLTKFISNLMKKNNRSLFKETVFKERKIKTFDLKQELLFLYQFFEFYYRYVIEIKPRLKKGDLVVTDRYFYDIYGQYPYARNSLILPLLLKIFPKPDRTFLLDAPAEILQKRGKTNRDSLSRQIDRQVMSRDYLNQQRSNYLLLNRQFKIDKLDAQQDLHLNKALITKGTWRCLI